MQCFVFKKMKKKIALIVDISEQDGSLLAKFLLSKNYVVYGTSRFKLLKKLKIIRKIKIFQLNTLAYNDIDKIIKKTRCNEIYYLFGQSSVKQSKKLSYETILSNNLPLVNILECVRKTKKRICNTCKCLYWPCRYSINFVANRNIFTSR